MPRRIVGDYSQVANKKITTAADEWGIGCMQERISFNLPNGKCYRCDKEWQAAQALLGRNKKLWPAVAMFPSGLTPDIIYAQCTFKYRPDDNYNYKEASGLNNILRKGQLVQFIREYNVASLIVSPLSLAEAIYTLDEPRIEESLFIVGSNSAIVSYQGLLRSTKSLSVLDKKTISFGASSRTTLKEPGLFRAIFRKIFD